MFSFKNAIERTGPWENLTIGRRRGESMSFL
jgi:hypothetical protein